MIAAALLLLFQPPEALQQQARESMQKGEFAKAAGLYESLRRQFPAEPGLQLNVGLAWYSAGKHELAEPPLAAFVRAQPDHAGAQLMLGVTRLKLNRPCDAVAPLQRAAALSPIRPEAHLELGSALMGCQKPAEAVPALEELTRLAPQLPRAWFALGEAQRQAGQREEARRSFTRLSLLPESAEFHELMAEAAHLDGRPEDAMQHWDRALVMAPEDRRLPRLRARGLWRARQYGPARDALMKLRLEPPRDATLEYELGDCVYRLDGPSPALPYFESAVRLSPALLPARAALGRALLEAGRPKEAIPHLETAAKAGIDPALWMALSNAYRGAGRAAEAKAAAARAKSAQQ
jgi:predicted Zn-dependent protease